MKKRISSIVALVAVVMLLMIPLFVTNASAAEESVTLSFASTDQRTSFSTSQQVWEQNGITLTNNKASSTSNVADYAGPARFYKNSEIIIEYPGMTKIVITCSGSSYAGTPAAENTNITKSGSTITIELNTPADSITLTCSGGQIRANSLTVYYETGGSDEPVEYTASFDVPVGANPIESITGSEITLPAAPTLNKEYAEDYVFAGWAASEISDDTTIAPKIFSAGETVTLTEDTTYYAVYTYSTSSGQSSYILTDIANISSNDVVVITATTSAGKVYAMSNNNGTGKAPSAVEVTLNDSSISSEVDENIKWNITYNSGNLTIYPNGTTASWLYCTSTNNGVRVGTNTSKTFTIDANSGYLKHSGTGRYLGVYTTTPDWRCYTNTTGNTANQTLGFYVYSGSATYYTTSLEIFECTHANTTEQTNNATCTVPGSITVICKECEEVISNTEIPATGHTFVDGKCHCGENAPVASFVIPEGATPIDNIIGEEITLPEEPTLDAGKHYLNVYTFCGWSTSVVDNVTASPIMYDAGDTVTLTTDTTYYAVYTYSAPTKAYLPISIENIKPTDDVVIAITTSDGKVYAMSNDNGTSTAPSAVAVTVTDGKINGAVASNLIWNISYDDGNLTIYPNGTTDTWLYCTNANNGVRVGTNKENYEFEIEDTYGYLFNTATSRYIGVFNGQDWRCYEPAPTEEKNSNIKDQTLGFYVLAEDKENTVDYFTTSLAFVAGEFTGASLNIGSDLSIRYHVILKAWESIDGYSVKFTMNGETIVVSEYSFENGKYVFSFCGIAPQCMGDDITAELIYSENEIDIIDNYSVKQYAIDALELYSDKTELCQLLADLLYYGAAAQEYTGYNKDSLVTNGLDLPDASSATPSEVDKNKSVSTADGDTKFTAAGVKFDYNNRIYVKFTAASLDGITVSVGGINLDISETGKDGVYIAYSDGISALKFGDTVTFTLSSGGNAIQTLVYTINDYAFSKYNDAQIGDLALALYRYGKSAVAYNATL